MNGLCVALQITYAAIWAACDKSKGCVDRNYAGNFRLFREAVREQFWDLELEGNPEMCVTVAVSRDTEGKARRELLGVDRSIAQAQLKLALCHAQPNDAGLSLNFTNLNLGATTCVRVTGKDSKGLSWERVDIFRVNTLDRLALIFWVFAQNPCSERAA